MTIRRKFYNFWNSAQKAQTFPVDTRALSPGVAIGKSGSALSVAFTFDNSIRQIISKHRALFASFQTVIGRLYVKNSTCVKGIKLCKSETKGNDDWRNPIRETETPPISALPIREITADSSIKKSLFRNSASWFAEDALNVCCLGDGDSSWV
ncbi:hypothetical protein CEXT_349011 [Caerostris extrusa]|uniref:Uncharacterized protein n=1 Tax=Caerostris extrusa TaxID=172846 RepID=A0AAV4QJF0_CAEEX|nr:hypothetical protein CEXT_349011 [Caerostris extrusa]